MDISTLLARSWQTATTGDGSVCSARDIVERWYDKGGELTRQFRLLTVLLYLGGYFPKGNAGGMLPEKCFILLNAPELSSLLADDTAPDVLVASCRTLFYCRQISPLRCYRHTRCLSEHLFQLMEI